MKKTLIFLLILITACKSQHINKTLEKLTESYITKANSCVKNATCNIEIIPKSILLVKQDDFKNTYIEIEKGNKTIIKYEFKKDEIPNTVDGNYSEILYIETDNYNKDIYLKDEQLQQVKMVYGRLCYCKGTSGYFKVKKGDLKFVLKKNQLTLKTNFYIENIPQLITKIDEVIKLN